MTSAAARPEYEAYVFDASDDEVAGCSGTKGTTPMIWPFSEIKQLKIDKELLRSSIEDQANYILRLERAKIQLLEKTQAQDKEIVTLNLQVDELRGQVHSATMQLASKDGQLRQALKNDTRGPKGRYTKPAANETSVPAPAPAKQAGVKAKSKKAT